MRRILPVKVFHQYKQHGLHIWNTHSGILTHNLAHTNGIVDREFLIGFSSDCEETRKNLENVRN